MDYQSLTDDKLLSLLFTQDDRLPRAAVDEFVRRGERMIKPLSEIVSEQYKWTKGLPEWWAVIHAVYILGAIGWKDVILPLLRGMRWAVAYDCDWVTEELPSIFGKIGIVAIDDLKLIAKDKTSDWFTRSMPIEGLAAITINHPDIEKDIFLFISSILKDISEDRAVRQIAGSVLIDFMRVEYREDLLAFGREEKCLKDEDFDYLHFFSDDDVEEWFSEGENDLKFYTKDWLYFYNEDEIRKRQERWKEEEEKDEAETEDEILEDDIDDPEPFIRESAKIGRNAPCPCGSGKKYKKCCIDKMTWN